MKVGNPAKPEMLSREIKLTCSSIPCNGSRTPRDSSCPYHQTVWYRGSWLHKATRDGSRAPSHPCRKLELLLEPCRMCAERECDGLREKICVVNAIGKVCEYFWCMEEDFVV